MALAAVILIRVRNFTGLAVSTALPVSIFLAGIPLLSGLSGFPVSSAFQLFADYSL
jgi:hypothetical protein